MEITDLPVVVIVFVLLAGIYLALLHALLKSAREWAVNWSLQKHGVLRHVEIQELWSEQPHFPSKKYSTYWIQYEVHTAKRPQRIIQQIGRRHYRQLHIHQQIDDSVLCSYLPCRPEISRLAGVFSDYTWRDGFSLAGFAAVICFPPTVILWGLVLWWYLRQYAPHSKEKPQHSKRFT